MRRVIALTCIGLAAGTLAAEAQDRTVGFHGLGPRVGFSIDPDQFVFGGHADFGDPFPSITWLLPVVEIGVGDDATVTTIGTDMFYKFSDRWGAWTPYAGAEVAFLIASVELPGGDDDTDTDLGLMGLFGVEKGIGEENRFSMEVKFELVDAPDVKFLVSWTFGH
jgi:hypothetical protein